MYYVREREEEDIPKTGGGGRNVHILNARLPLLTLPISLESLHFPPLPPRFFDDFLNAFYVLRLNKGAKKIFYGSVIMLLVTQKIIVVL